MLHFAVHHEAGCRHGMFHNHKHVGDFLNLCINTEFSDSFLYSLFKQIAVRATWALYFYFHRSSSSFSLNNFLNISTDGIFRSFPASSLKNLQEKPVTSAG
jgi:hypothetical protein